MDVTVEVVGEGESVVSVPDDATYADVVRETEYNRNEVSVLVDGSPVPEDAPAEADRVTVLRLIKGGDGDR